MSFEEYPTLDRKGALAKLGGREALQAKLEKSFRRDAPQNMERIRRALADGDMDEATLVSHKLKGEANTVGALRLGKTAQAFHEDAKAGKADVLPGKLPGLEVEVESALAAMA